MVLRLTLAAIMFAVATPLLAFFGTPAGYTLSEHIQSSGASGIAWDPAGSDFYAHHNGGIRRFDTNTNTFSSTLFFPAPVGKYFDHLAIDPTSPNDFYVSYSSGTNAEITKITRTAPDAGTVAASFDYSAPAHYIFRLAFVPDIATVPAALRGQLLIASVDPTFAAGVYLVNKTTLALTKLIDVGTYNGNGPITFDSQGNVYAAIPATYGSFAPAVVRRFEAANVAAAISGTPVASTQGTDVITGADGVWNITAMSGRREGGQDYIYYSTYEHASIFRFNVKTRESRLFMQGFGGVSDGYSHFAQGGSIAFSDPTDDFQPCGGGSVRLAVPFTVYTPGYGFYASVFLVTPASNSANVAQLVVSQQPTSINSGVPFSIEVDALDGTGAPANAKVGVIAEANGAGSLDGFTVVAGPDDKLNFSGLVYTTGTLPETFTITIELTDNPGISVTTASITVVAPATQLAVSAQPSDVEVSSFFGVTVQVRDGSAMLVSQGSDAAREVTATVTSGPGNLWGQTTVTSVGGVATFDALIVDEAGAYEIQFSSPGLTPVNVNLTVTSPTIDDDDGDSNGGGCAAGGNGGWPALLGLLALLGVAVRLRRARA